MITNNKTRAVFTIQQKLRRWGALSSYLPAVVATLVLLLFCVASLCAQTPPVSFAGVTSGARIVSPSGQFDVGAKQVAVNGAGEIFVVASGGTIVRVPAGGGTYAPVWAPPPSTSGSSIISSSIAVDQSNNVWLVDAYSNRLMKIQPDAPVQYFTNANVISSVATDASNNVYYSATSATLQIPSGSSTPAAFSNLATSVGAIALDAAGNFYIVRSQKVYKAAPGCNSLSCAVVIGVGNDGSAIDSATALAVDRFGNVFIFSSAENRISKIPPGCTIRACQTLIDPPNSVESLAVTDRGELYLTDTGGTLWLLQLAAADFHNVNVGSTTTLALDYKISSAVNFGSDLRVLTQGTPGLDFGLSSTTCTGSRTAGTSCRVTVSFTPRAPGLRMGAVQLRDSSGNVLVTTPLRGVGMGPAIAFAWGTSSPVGGGVPSDVVVDAAGNVFFADSASGTITKIPAGCASSACQTTVASGLGQPIQIAVDGAGALLVASAGSSSLVKIPPECASSACRIPVGSGLLYTSGVTLDGAGNVLISDFDGGRVVQARDNCTGEGCQAVLISGLIRPEGIALSASNDLYIAQPYDNTVKSFPKGCTAAGVCATNKAAGLSFPMDVALDAAGSVFVANTTRNEILDMPPVCPRSNCGTLLSTDQSPSGLAVDSVGNLFVANLFSHEVSKFSGSEASLLTFPPTVVGSQSSPLSVTVRNIGNGTATFGTMSVSANFGVNGGCPPVLEPGEFCRVEVYCAPATSGTLTGTLTLTNDALNRVNATQTVPLSCPATGLPRPQVGFAGAPATATYQSSFLVAATSNGGTMPVISSTGPCSVSTVTGAPANASATVTMTSGSGTCSLTASWPADANFAAGSATQTTIAALAAPTLVFSGAPATASYQSAFTVVATSNASTTATITAAGACSNFGTLITMTSATGSCSLTATWPSDANYTAGTATQTTVAAKASPAVTFTGAPATATYQSTFTVVATTNGSTVATLTASGACSVQGTTVTMTSGTGTCVLTADWAADTNYAAATRSQTTTAAKAAPAVTFSGAPASAAYQSTFTVASTSNGSTVAVITASGACSVQGSTATMTSATGSCVLTANWAADSNYAAATRSQTTTAIKATPVVTFTGAPASANYRSTYTVSSTSNGSTAGVITASGACSIQGSTVTMTSGTGACLLTATWAADANYNDATAAQSTAASQIAPAVTVTGAPASANYQSTFNVVSTTNASTSAVITASGACSIQGAAVTMTSGTGLCTLTATWAADNNYSGAIATRTTTAAKIAPVVTFTGAPASAAYGSTFTVAAGTNAATAAVISASGACSIQGAAVTMTSGTGSCALLAAWAADNNYLAATATRTTTASKIAPVVSFTGAPASAASGVSFQVTAATNSSAAVLISASGPCSVSATKVTMTGNTGTCQLTANWASDSNYLAASATQSTLTAGALVNNLSALLKSFNLSNGSSLNSQLQAVANDLQGNKMNAACSDLTDFISMVQSQCGKKLTVAQAQQLLTGAAQISSTIGCS